MEKGSSRDLFDMVFVGEVAVKHNSKVADVCVNHHRISINSRAIWDLALEGGGAVLSGVGPVPGLCPAADAPEPDFWPPSGPTPIGSPADWPSAGPLHTLVSYFIDPLNALGLVCAREGSWVQVSLATCQENMERLSRCAAGSTCLLAAGSAEESSGRIPASGSGPGCRSATTRLHTTQMELKLQPVSVLCGSNFICSFPRPLEAEQRVTSPGPNRGGMFLLSVCLFFFCGIQASITILWTLVLSVLCVCPFAALHCNSVECEKWSISVGYL